ncbi:MAG: hypothetical protein GTO18_10190 [Anaerolineales bacterium]|nr:hypothetical protein [Anaerolineales bacterium]
MEKFTIAAVQMNALRGDLDHNLEVHHRITQEAASAGASLVIFPELSVTAHYGDADVTELAEEAERGRIYDSMRAWAEEHGVRIGYGFCEKAHGTFYNSYALTGPEGLIGLQRKVHASQDEYFSFRMGRSFEVIDIGFCKIGILICFDASFFEAWRVMALKGADLLLLPHAGRSGMGEEIPEDKQLEQLSGILEKLPGRYGIYAEDNALFVVYCNQVGYNGHTTHSGGAYVIGPDGNLLTSSELSLEDLWIRTEVDLEAQEKARNSRYSLLRTRRPEMYGEITDPI